MKHILITGASSGIGYQTALHLANQGCSVIAIARNIEKLRLLQSEHDQIEIFQVDLNDNKSLALFSEYFRQQKIVLNGIIFNAGSLILKPFLELTEADWQSQFNTNFFANVRLLKSVFSSLADRSHLLSIGSMGGFLGSSKYP